MDRERSERSDPHAWLRIIFARLKADPGFNQLSPARQFQLLRQAVAEHHPEQATQMAQWSTAAQESLIDRLATMTEHDTPPAAVSLLWTVQQHNRQLRCVAQYLSTGLDLRLLQGQNFVRTQLCHTAREAHEVSEQWLAALLERGWRHEP